MYFESMVSTRQDTYNTCSEYSKATQDGIINKEKSKKWPKVLEKSEMKK